jgi:hypothetical protein
MRVKLAHNSHDIEALVITFKNGECEIDVTIEWLEDIVEKKMKFGLPYGIFSSQNDAEAWGLLAALRWTDAGKPHLISFPFSDTFALAACNKDRQPFAVKRRLEFPARTRIVGKMLNSLSISISRILQQYPQSRCTQ